MMKLRNFLFTLLFLLTVVTAALFTSCADKTNAPAEAPETPAEVAVKADPDHKPTGKLIIPAKKSGKPVTEIIKFGFDGCEGTTGLIVPDNIKSIQSNAFQNCIGLKRAYIADGVDLIDHHTFADCSQLTEIHLPESIEHIENHLFYGCTALETVNIPKNLKSLKHFSFAGTAIRSAVLPASITYMEGNAFADCQKLTALTMEKGGKKYFSENNCIIGKKDLTLYIGIGVGTIPSCVKKINQYAFYQCRGLTDIVIPGTVEIIDDSAFTLCTNLKSVVFEEGIKTIGTKASNMSSGSPFEGSTSLTSLTVDENNRTLALLTQCWQTADF